MANDGPASFHASPAEALSAPAEEFLYLACLHEGTGVEKPDFLAVIDAEEGRIVHETPMPNVGDELHHYGWNRCSSACHGPDRSHLIVPGFRSSRIHLLDVASDPRRPRIEHVIEPEELVRETGLTRPHTVHCMPGDNVVISMLGDADGNGACGFAVLDARTFEIKGRWENGGDRSRRSTTTSGTSRARTCSRRRSSASPTPTRRASISTTSPRAGTAAGCTSGTWRSAGSSRRSNSARPGMVPLEIRWLHDPDADEGFVGAALSSTMWHFHRDNGSYSAEKVIAVEGVEQEGWPFPVPGLITDLVVSMDDRFLYFSNWLHGDLRQYDISDPAQPAARPDSCGSAASSASPSDAGRELDGGPQMLQLSLDGRRLYVTNSLYSTWDNQFYPEPALLAAAGRLPPGRRDGARPRLLRRLPDRPAARRAHTRSACRAATARRRSSNDRVAHITGAGEELLPALVAAGGSTVAARRRPRAGEAGGDRRWLRRR